MKYYFIELNGYINNEKLPPAFIACDGDYLESLRSTVKEFFEHNEEFELIPDYGFNCFFFSSEKEVLDSWLVSEITKMQFNALASVFNGTKDACNDAVVYGLGEEIFDINYWETQGSDNEKEAAEKPPQKSLSTEYSRYTELFDISPDKRTKEQNDELERLAKLLISGDVEMYKGEKQ